MEGRVENQTLTLLEKKLCYLSATVGKYKKKKKIVSTSLGSWIYFFPLFTRLSLSTVFTEGEFLKADRNLAVCYVPCQQ